MTALDEACAGLACTASRYGHHDYSRSPHNTPDDPRDAPDKAPCQAQCAHEPFGSCQHERRYEIVIYQPGTHDWIRMLACVPCTATLRRLDAIVRLGPGGTGGTGGIYRICDYHD